MSTPPEAPPEDRSGRALAAVCLAAAALYLVGLGATDLWAPDEPRYTHVASEIFSMQHGARGLVVMHVNGEPYSDKPPLYFWLAALASLPFGAVDEISARLPSALAGVAAVAATFLLGRRLFDARVACWGAALLASVFDFAFLARRARLDVLLTLCVVVACLAFWRIDRGIGRRRANVALCHGAMGLGILTKGPVALLPLLAGAVYLVWERRPRDWLRAAPAWGWGLSLGPALIWISAAVLLTPQGFFDAAVVDNLYGGFFQGLYKHEPWYFFLYQFPVNFLPWTLLWPLLLLELRRRARLPQEERPALRSWRFLLAWLATYFVFFSLSAGKRGLYLLPAFPATALLCGAALESALARRPERLLRRAPLWLAIGLGVLGLGVLLLRGSELPGAPDVKLPGGFGVALVSIALLAGLAWLRLGRNARSARGPLALLVGLVAAVELAVFSLLHPAFEPAKSPRLVAEAAAALTAPGEPIGLFGHQAMVGGLAYYSARPIAQLWSSDDVRRFVETGGRVIASKAARLPEIRRAAAFDVAASFRSGRRRYLVLKLAEGQAPEGRAQRGAAERRLEPEREREARARPSRPSASASAGTGP